ncbi:MAG: 30S ribosomal protein S4 [Nanoarchaeota archaeon]|nr:30S ribosomal protein S4 [Nanoarchaeota archaeon]MCG2717360.1 30S ribosomal protein S4 [Nanoarchaeota archaeon]
MGDPKRPKKKYKTPTHPWQRERIEEERIIKKEYGLKNKKEIWRIDSLLKRFKQQAKNLIARNDTQSQIEEKQLVDRLTKLNLVNENAKMDDILGLEIKNLMDRRLQTQVLNKGLSRTISQARQLIVHGHIFVGDKKVTIPSYMVKSDEEAQIRFDDRSTFINPEHPERVVQKKEKKKEVKPKRGTSRKAKPKKEKAESKSAEKEEKKAKPKEDKSKKGEKNK